ncbi:E2/UBC family protein [Mesorhizobium sp. CA7]|uniref:E2/UBC family protein n=1 Tax=Mesorhizobium sp. CA7 TaxID=588501 RepID=UPI001CCC9D2B|nr:E2/UBC family protein [Mesorhizobium sp. CA7]MBZ9813832.1 ThiF family adenylyltransferase [Mesorhizobium sp. CA7]
MSKLDTYRGRWQINPTTVPVEVIVQDFDFVQYPVIRILDPSISKSRKLPHILGPDGIVCYYGFGAAILDRYDPGGTIVRCLAKAEKVLTDALSGRLDGDFAAEFASYWATSWMLYDLPRDYSGLGSVVYPHLRSDKVPTPVLIKKSSWVTERDPASKNGAEAALIVTVNEPLSLDPTVDWPPENLLQLKRWLRWVAPGLTSKLDEALIKSNRAGAILAVRATNGLFALRLDVPRHLQTTEFLKQRRSSLPKVMDRMAANVPVERIRADAADPQYIYGRNIGSRRNFGGKAILVIGCGTIGGFLAHQLAQSGAGTAGGRLVLADTDDLRTANLGRHLLGVPYLHCNKAEATAAFIKTMLPDINVEAEKSDGLTIPTERFALVIDVTGEETLSIALNQKAIDSRPDVCAHIFGWLVGNGAIAQCILVDSDVDKACFKCLKPELGGQPRFRTLKPDAHVEIGSIAACGDAEFTPFPVSRSISAAAQVLELALDWVNGNTSPRFRSQTFDSKQAYHVSNTSPLALSTCPACNSRR